MWGDLKVRGFAMAAAAVAGLMGLLPPAAAAEQGEAQPCMRLFEARSYPEAQACFQGYLAGHGEDAAAMAYLGRSFLARRRPWAAIDWLKRAVSREPERSDFHDWLAQAYGTAAERAPVVRQFGLAVKAGREFERAVALDPSNLDAVEDLIEFQIEAPAVLGGSVAKAQAHAADLERRDRLRGRLALAQVLLHAQGLAATERELLAAAAEFPADPRPQVALGVALAGAGQYERAFGAFDAALRLDPGNADAQVELARAAALSGQRLESAEELLARYLRSVPPGDGAALADGHLGMGALLEKRRAVQQARSEYRAALDLDPDSALARKALRRLDRDPAASP
jgi:tetratricopeptide (TPR) repeat protein